MAHELNIRLNKPQSEAIARVQPGCTVMTGWGRGIGKSWFQRLLWWLYVAQYDGKTRSRVDPETGVRQMVRGVQIGVLMPTLKQYKDVHAAGINTELSGQWAFLGGKYNASTGKITFPGGSTITPAPAAEHTSQKSRGLRLDIVSLDEADDIPAATYDGVVVPWMSAHWSMNISLLGGTPTRGRNGLWWRTMEFGRIGEKLRNGATPEELGIDPEDADALMTCYSFHATYRDAPDTVSPEVVAKARATMPKATFEREWEANPDAGEGLIYAEFDESFHVRQPPPMTTFSEFHIGIDHGDVDPGVMILFGVAGHGEDAAIWALDEWYEPGVRNSVWDERLKAWREPVPGSGIISTAWPDPSRQDRIRDWRAMGMRVRDIHASVKPIKAGIARVAERLMVRTNEANPDWPSYARFYITPKCQCLIREFGLYKRKKLGDGLFSEDPEDKNNHAMDAMRYAVSGKFGPAPGCRNVVGGR